MYFDTPIKTKDGTEQIKHVKVGDLIQTSKGVLPVRDIIPYTDIQNIEIQFESGLCVVCPWDQEFLVNGKWVYAKDLWILHEIVDMGVDYVLGEEHGTMCINRIILFVDCGGLDILAEGCDDIILANGVITRRTKSQEDEND